MKYLTIVLLLFALPASAQEKKDPLFTASAIYLFVGPVLDWKSTHDALELGCCVEANAIKSWGGTWKGFALQEGLNLVLYLGARQYHKTHPKIASILLFTAGTPYYWASVHNWRNIQ